MKLIERSRYLDRLAGLRGTPDIKIITGMRRSGKSKLLEAFSQRVKEESPGHNLIYIDLVDFENEPLKEAAALHRHIESRYREGVENLLFIDEVQLCRGFERAVNSLHAKGKYDIYLTGSNAFLLSADLATLFTGRFIEVHVFPFSFAEYCVYHSDRNDDADTLFDSYAEEGGLAGSYLYRSERDRKTYIEDVYKTILFRDLVQKHGVTDRTALERLSEFLLDNIGNV
ncbi:MAG: AAA family ATPase, partial [Thermoguttaceae bacterium]|nr:AAA family ATPase [Thermoguttaceae bacterium]